MAVIPTPHTPGLRDPRSHVSALAVTITITISLSLLYQDQRSYILYHSLILAEPLFEHHQDPDHRAVVPGVTFYVDGGQLVDEVGAHDVPALEIAQTVERHLPQRGVRLQPRAERQAEAVLGLRDDLVRQEAAQRLLEEIAQ